MVLIINVSNILKYSPMRNDTVKNRRRLDILSDIANETNTDIDKIVWYFSKYIASIINYQIKKSIESQKVVGKSMKSVYKPLNKKYSKSKPYGTKTKFWINSGFLVNNIKVYQSGGTLYVGVPEKIKYKGSKISVKKVILYMEKGTKKQPPRPLITPIVRELEKRIDRVFNNFVKEITK